MSMMRVILHILFVIAVTAVVTISFELNRARISVDYGPRLIGIAKSDVLGCVRPLVTLNNHGNITKISQEILALALSMSASEIIVGIPLDSKGIMDHNIRNFNGRLCLNFSSVLSCVVINENTRPIRTFLFDERYTTKEAKQRIKQDRSIRTASLDAVSAMCLMERYLEDEAEGAIEAIPCAYPVPKILSDFDYDTVRKYIRDLHWSDAQHKKKKWVTTAAIPRIRSKSTEEGKAEEEEVEEEDGGGGDDRKDKDEEEEEEEEEEDDDDDDDDEDEDEEEEEEEMSMEDMIQERERRRKKGTLKSLNRPKT